MPDADISVWYYFVIAILVILSAFFSGTETAFSSLSKVRIKTLIEDGNKRAVQTMKVYEKYDRAISAILIGNNVVNIGSSSLATIVCIAFFGSAGSVVSTIVMTVIVLIFGEVLPKSIAKNNAESIALAVAPILLGFMKILTPFTAFFSGLIALVNKVLLRNKQEQPSVTEDELKIILEEIEDEGVLNEHDSKLMQSALDFTQIAVDEVLTPRVDVVAAEEHDSAEHIKDLFMAEGYSRIPIYRKDMDHILGVINSKDFFKIYLDAPEKVSVESLLQPVLYVPPKKLIAPLMKELQRRKMHMAIVTDQYGGTIGIATLEDMIEEIIGDVWDENDEVETEFIKQDDTHFLASGDMNIGDLFEQFEIEGPEELNVNTVGGWVQSNLDRMPQVGDSFVYDTLSVRVEQVQNKRVALISILFTPKEFAEG